MIPEHPMPYPQRCRFAAIAQGLEAFLDRPGWTVEQTGGFTMVAARYLPDGTVWTVTDEGADEDGGYLVARQPVAVWEDSSLWDNGEVEAHDNLTRAQVFALAEAPVPLGDADAVTAIHAVLDAREWTVDDLETIAGIVRSTGREIREPNHEEQHGRVSSE